MRCPYCGFENPGRLVFCNSCGKELPSTSASETAYAVRHCVSCGRSIGDDANVCPYCGHDYRFKAGPQVVRETISTGFKVVFYILSILVPFVGFIVGAIYYTKSDPESKHIGLICIVLGVICIVAEVGLVILLYVLTFGYTSDNDSTTPSALLSRTIIANGKKFTVTAVTTSPTWSDVEILLSDGVSMVQWSPSSIHLSDAGSYSTERFAPVLLGAITVFCNVTDLSGNGRFDFGDYFTLTTGSAEPFSTGTIYVVTLLHEPTAGKMYDGIFAG